MRRFDDRKSVVVNNKQTTDGIVSAVYPAVYNVVSSIVTKSGGNNVTFEVSGDPYGLFNVIKKETDNYFDRNGRPAFAN